MKNNKCLIECLYNHISSKVVLKFQHKKITLKKEDTAENEHNQNIVIEEDSLDSRLKKLTIKSDKKSLIDGIFPNSTFLGLDRKEEELSCYTHFVKKSSGGLRQKCDFAFIYKNENSIHVVISELKSSHKGINDRCHGQFSRSKLFLKYLIDLISEVENINTNIDLVFYKAIFMPAPKFAVAVPEPITPEEEKLPLRYKDDYTIFELPTDLEDAAEIDIKLLVSSIPKMILKNSSEPSQDLPVAAGAC
jgi:hypothetical protein